MKISIVIPARNEAENIEPLINEIVTDQYLQNHEKEVIIVDDNSTDKTGLLVDELSSKYDWIKGIHRKNNPGFGSTIKSGFSVVTGDVIVVVMGDLSDLPSDISKLIQGIENGYDVTFGSRFINGGCVQHYPFLKLVYNRAFSLFIRMIFGLKIKDVTNGFKAYKKEVLRSFEIESDGFEINAELPLRAYLHGFKFIEVPVRYFGRKRGVAKFKYGTMGWRYLRVAIKLWKEYLKASLRRRLTIA